MITDYLRYSLALIRAPGIGSAAFAKLSAQFDDLSEIFNLKNIKYFEKILPEETLAYLRNPDWCGVEEDLMWSTQPHHHLVSLQDSFYPAYLHQISDPPPILYVKGLVEALQSPQIAIVGSRNASFAGKENAFQFAYTLSQQGIVITSGLALGIDAQSHLGALEAHGQTVAVLGSGVEQIYPKQHIALAEKIVNHGALVSEFPLKAPPLAKHFPQRNRIISGLSLGVLIVEAAKQSGSLVTARLANEQGREVFAIPGSIQNALTKGCHYLIQSGAKLVEKASDILEELDVRLENTEIKRFVRTTTAPLFETDEEHQVWGCLEDNPVPIDKIILRSGLTMSDVSSILLSFEDHGFVQATPAGYLRMARLDYNYPTE